MSKNLKYIILILLSICGISLFSITSKQPDSPIFNIEYTPQQEDTINKYAVKKTQITDFEELTKKQPIDLQDPSNVKTTVEYDLNNNVYLFKTTIDNDEWVTPFTLNPKQYLDYSLKESMSEYFRKKNSENLTGDKQKEGFSLKDIKVNMSSLDRIFGPGGVQLKTQGYVEVTAGMKHTFVDNPTLSQNKRSRTLFNFDEKIQMNVAATVGDKVNFDMNYDTESTFDFDSKKVKLAYEGKEDEIIKYLEAGNVSLNTTNSLINGGASLFGVRADLQFGKLKVNTVISQQESQTQTVSSKGGVQTISYEFTSDQYDENQHFFLAQYFRDNFDAGMSKLPYINSNIRIDKVEVWITNKQNNFDNARNIVAFADLAEHNKIGNDKWKATDGNLEIPYNGANNLYTEINNNYNSSRDINQTTGILNGASLVSGQDYEKIESARLLDASEYTLNAELGYISLNSALNSDEVLAVAYQYRYGTSIYKVGEFASEITTKYVEGEKTGALFLKLLKPTSLTPQSYTWNLMMKNIYPLGSRQIEKDKFRLNITYLSDTIGTYVNYLPEGDIKGEMLLRVMNLDRLNSQNNVGPDGIFDFVANYTIYPENGRIIFPVVEPFGKHLRKKINNNTIADKYVYQELYDSTLTVAQQIADKNKFKISGTMRASSSDSEIQLGSMNVAQGSVKVTANGTTLTENVDYTVDYTSGTVKILNQALIDAGTPINVSLENQSLFSLQRKTLLGLNLSYEFTKNFNLGATIVHMYEKPITTKSGVGSESVKNTLWGLNTSYRTESQWLTNLVDKLPFVNASTPSQISFNGEFAQMIAGHYENKYSGGYSYIDDFESAKTKISVLEPVSWKLAATPRLFEEWQLINNIEYGNNRAHLAWFKIDNLFTRKNSSQRPSHLTDDDLSNHFVRQIDLWEIYPDKEILTNESSYLTPLNLSYYPQQRGMYNLDSKNIDSEGKLLNPENRWGGISRKIENKDFESSNIENIEFWLMDPFVYNDTAKVPNSGGFLYFNLGEISEDILKDGKKFYENGLPTDDDLSLTTESVWGRVPSRQSTVYAFDNGLTEAERKRQDVGFSGLTNEQKLSFKTYVDYSNEFRSKLTSTALTQMQEDPFSPINDLTGDKYHFYRGSDYDTKRVSILDRYKYYNGTAGNSFPNEVESYSTAATPYPDVEDLNQDNTLNEKESYYQYKVPLDPKEMEVGKNYIADKRVVTVTLRNGQTSNVTWYQFKVPIKQGEKVGNIQNFKSIRFMRMFLTGFQQNTFLRFGTLDLVRGEWRTYTQALKDGINQGDGTLNVSTVNIEENSTREPVNYVLPPGVTRVVDPSQPQLVQENEQALSLKVTKLQPSDARAVYKNTNYDLRRYKRIQMFSHAEEVIGESFIEKGEVTVFLRLGTDFKNNYYEYEIPMTITPAGQYNSTYADQLKVWPKENMFDFPLELLKNLKLKRNKEKRKANSLVSYTDVYSEYDPDNLSNKVSVIGNPSLSEVKVLMIGIRNNSHLIKSAEVWVNELRLTDFDDEGGWAAQGNLNIALSDIGSISIAGRKETSGFGAIDQGMMERRSDDYYSYDISTNVDLGRFLPEKASVSIPLYYAYSNQTTTPKYDPFDQDVTMKESLSLLETKAEKDSLKNLAQEKTTTKSLSLSNVRVNIKSKNPMPYDPANFTFGYAQSITEVSNPTTVYDQTKNYKASLSYSYSPGLATWEPFKNIKSKSPISKYPKSVGINLLPSNIAINSVITRYYTETRTRDLDSYTLGGDNSQNQFLSWSQTFYWDRDLSITWDLLRNLKMSIQTGTRAEIVAPDRQVNKKLNREDYEIWKDSVIQSIKNLGDPLSYKQRAQLVYTLPFSNIPYVDWINSSASYDSNYTWDRGAKVDSVQIGNTITNSVSLAIKNDLDLTSLYNKSTFLRKVNQKFEMNQRRQSQRAQRAKRETRKKPFAQDLQLNTDSFTIVKHGLATKNIEVTAKKEGKNFKIKYKKIDENTIRINTKDTAQIKINVVQKGDAEETTLYKIAEYAARGLMSVRSLSINYTSTQETAIAGFIPGIGNAFGQKSGEYGLTPGLGFAFGLDYGEDYINKSLNNNWLVLNEMSISPAVHNSVTNLELTAMIEPVKGLKIQLNALREKNDRTSFQFNNYPTVYKTFGGSFSMTTISLSSAFENSNAKNNYKSASFDKFLKNRDVIVNRLENKYDGLPYPASGFISGTGINGKYDKTIASVNKNSADVLIPAFLAAYTGGNSNKISLTAFPSLSALLPNWRVNYDGLTTLPWFKEKFKRLRLSHAYSSLYNIGSYSSFSTWVQADGGSGDYGFIQNLDGKPAPSSPYDISSVNLVEQFNPLFGVDGTLVNNMTIRARYNYTRNLNLNITSFQIVENLQKDFIFGLGYRINEFNKLLGIHMKKDRGFNNDLNITADLSHKKTHSLIRRIEEEYTDATAGTVILTLKLSAEYTFSRALLMRAFYDRIVNTPLISATAYPTANSNFGISIRFTLTQ